MTLNQVKVFIADQTDDYVIMDIIKKCAAKLGWQMAIETNPPNDDVRGVAMGTDAYLKEVFR